MSDFITAWLAIDQHIAFVAFLTACAVFTGWVLYGEHRTGGRK